MAAGYPESRPCRLYLMVGTGIQSVASLALAYVILSGQPGFIPLIVASALLEMWMVKASLKVNPLHAHLPVAFATASYFSARPTHPREGSRDAVRVAHATRVAHLAATVLPTGLSRPVGINASMTTATRFARPLPRSDGWRRPGRDSECHSVTVLPVTLLSTTDDERLHPRTNERRWMRTFLLK